MINFFRKPLFTLLTIGILATACEGGNLLEEAKPVIGPAPIVTSGEKTIDPTTEVTAPAVETPVLETPAAEVAAETPAIDADGDGFTSDVDCADDNPDVNPGIEERTFSNNGGRHANSIDDDCDGEIDEPGLCDCDDLKGFAIPGGNEQAEARPSKHKKHKKADAGSDTVVDDDTTTADDDATVAEDTTTADDTSESVDTTPVGQRIKAGSFKIGDKIMGGGRGSRKFKKICMNRLEVFKTLPGFDCVETPEGKGPGRGLTPGHNGIHPGNGGNDGDDNGGGGGIVNGGGDDDTDTDQAAVAEKNYAMTYDIGFKLIDKTNSDIRKDKFFQAMNVRIDFQNEGEGKFLQCKVADMKVEGNRLNSRQTKAEKDAEAVSAAQAAAATAAVGVGAGMVVHGVIAVGADAAAAAAANGYLIAIAEAGNVTGATVATVATATEGAGTLAATTFAEGAIVSNPVGWIVGGVLVATVGTTYLVKALNKDDGAAFNIIYQAAYSLENNKCKGNFTSLEEYQNIASTVANIKQVSLDVNEEPNTSLGIERLVIKAIFKDDPTKGVTIYDNPTVMAYLNDSKDSMFPNSKSSCAAANVNGGFIKDSEGWFFHGINNYSGGVDAKNAIRHYPIAQKLVFSRDDLAVKTTVISDKNVTGWFKTAGTERTFRWAFENSDDGCGDGKNFVEIFDGINRDQTRTSYFYLSAISDAEISDGGALSLDCIGKDCDQNAYLTNVTVNAVKVWADDATGLFKHYKLQKKGDEMKLGKEDNNMKIPVVEGFPADYETVKSSF